MPRRKIPDNAFDFYFGLGCEVANPEAWRQAELVPETGTLLRVRAIHFTLR